MKKSIPLCINTCPICTTIPHYLNLEDAPLPAAYRRLKQIYREDMATGRYETDWHMILQCPRCNTYYHHNDYEDREDAMAAGPWTHNNLGRYSFTRLQAALKMLKLHKEATVFQEHYEHKIREYRSLVEDHPGDIHPNVRIHILESVVDYFLHYNDWQGLIELLQNKNGGITLSIADSLILLYGNIPQKGIFAGPVNYHDVTEATKKIARNILGKNRKQFFELLIDVIPRHPARVKRTIFSLLDSADYRKIKTRDVLPRMISYLSDRHTKESFKKRLLAYIMEEDIDILKNPSAVKALLGSPNDKMRSRGFLLVKDYLKKKTGRAGQIITIIEEIKESQKDNQEVNKLYRSCKYYISRGQDTIAVTPKMIKDFDRAISQKNVKIIKELLTAGLSQKHAAKYWPWATSMALELSNKKDGAEILALLYKNNNSLINFVPINGDSALSIASRKGLQTAVETLLKHGADVNTRDYYKGTPLISAALGGNETIITILLDHGAKPELVDNQKRTALMWACYKGHVPIVKTLLAVTPRTALTKKDWLDDTVFTLSKGKSRAKSEIRRLLNAKAKKT